MDLILNLRYSQCDRAKSSRLAKNTQEMCAHETNEMTRKIQIETSAPRQSFEFFVCFVGKSSTRDACATLSTDSLVMAEPALPHEACPHPRQQEPASLDGQRLRKVSSF